jgi:hypothetical protein
VAVIAANWLLTIGYGEGPDVTGSNFALTFCGLSIGDVWSACQERYAAQLTGIDERSQANVLYLVALKNIAADPAVFIMRLMDGAIRYAVFLPNTLLRGYLWNPMPVWFSRSLVLTITSAGLVFLVFSRRERGEIQFWLLFGAATLASAAFVYYDSGMRVMCMSYPLIIAFTASGFVTSNHVAKDWTPSQMSRYVGSAAAMLVVGLMFLLPSAAYALLHKDRNAAQLIPGTHAVFGGREINGFLVVADGEPLPIKLPAMHYSDFEAILKQSNLEIYQGLLHPRAPALPFGLIDAPRAEPGTSSGNQYIVPPEVLTRRDVSVWRFNTVDWPPNTPVGRYWLYVEKAEALK